MIPILILAAGTATRMRGTDKLLEPVGGIPLLRVIALRALKTGEPVFVALPSADHPRANVIADLDVDILPVPMAAEGMGASLREAVAQLPDAAAFMVMLGDLVAITTADMAAVLAACHDEPDNLVWRGSTDTGKPGHPIVFDNSLRPEFHDLAGDHGGDVIIKPLADRTCLVPLPGNHARLDLDTPEDWHAWRANSD